jgi:3-mercaptopyruvate sulfurtransferase SseA
MRHNRNEFGTPEPGETATAMEDMLRFHTAAWDLSVDLKAGLAAIVIDARCRDASIAGHIPGAVSFPHREMNSETTARLDRARFTSFAMGSAVTPRRRALTNSRGWLAAAK